MKNLLIFFAAGSLGALANSIAVWLFGQLGINAAFGVSIAPPLSPEWLYPRIVWGGLWGLLFILPFWSSKLLLKGALLSFFPSAFQLFVVFPVMAGKGVAGFELGVLTPVLVLFFNWIWGVVTALTIKAAR
ncbi:hypothetical protein [Microbulbifer sp. TRSA002]|uniref:hypothetical protein n=1 Tax=unclassified Microbulbifer TaxID=2619833 RepID=UPI00403A30DD